MNKMKKIAVLMLGLSVLTNSIVFKSTVLAEEGIYIPKYPDRGAANSAFKIAQFILKNRTKVTNVIRIFPIFVYNCYNMGKRKRELRPIALLHEAVINGGK